VAQVVRCVDTWHTPGQSLRNLNNRHGHPRSLRDRPARPRLASGRAAWIPDVTQDANFPRALSASIVGFHSAFGFPIFSGGEVQGVLEFFSTKLLRRR